MGLQDDISKVSTRQAEMQAAIRSEFEAEIKELKQKVLDLELQKQTDRETIIKLQHEKDLCEMKHSQELALLKINYEKEAADSKGTTDLIQTLGGLAMQYVNGQNAGISPMAATPMAGVPQQQQPQQPLPQMSEDEYNKRMAEFAKQGEAK